MNVKSGLIACIISLSLSGISAAANGQDGKVIGNGQMPNVTIDGRGIIYTVYGSHDSLLIVSSADKGQNFSRPGLIYVLPGLAASHTRGPQIANTSSGILVTAANNEGDIYSFLKSGGKWGGPVKINDVDTIAKEGLMALSADGPNVFAVWLDLRGNRKNKIYGVRSVDGGKTWSKNLLVYASPETSVCECCKPSVVVKGNSVYVMFRNWMQGNRDMYLAQSNDMGRHFNKVEKLGLESWKLNGCPMDGGGLMVINNQVKTTWRRQNNIYAASPGQPEKMIGTGKGCTMTALGEKEAYAWTENGEIVVMVNKGEKKMVGKGSQPVLKAIDGSHLICTWSYDEKIRTTILTL